MYTSTLYRCEGEQVQPWEGGTDGPDNPDTRPKRCTFATESKPTKEDIIEINVRASAATTLNRHWGGVTQGAAKRAATAGGKGFHPGPETLHFCNKIKTNIGL